MLLSMRPREAALRGNRFSFSTDSFFVVPQSRHHLGREQLDGAQAFGHREIAQGEMPLALYEHRVFLSVEGGAAEVRHPPPVGAAGWQAVGSENCGEGPGRAADASAALNPKI